jgi:hypothetical protein
VVLSVALRAYNEAGQVQLSLTGWAKRARVPRAYIAATLRKLLTAGYLIAVQRGGPGRLGATMYSIEPVLALLAGDGGAMIRAVRADVVDAGTTSPPPKVVQRTNLGWSENQTIGDSPKDGPSVVRELDQEQSEKRTRNSPKSGLPLDDRENKERREGDARRESGGAGARATAPPASAEEEDDVEVHNDDFAGWKGEQPGNLAPGGLRRTNLMINYFQDRLREVRGIPNPTVTGRDKGLFRSWLQDQPVDESVRRALDRFVQDDDPFVKRNGWSLGLLPRRANGYLAVPSLPHRDRPPAPSSVAPQDGRVVRLTQLFSEAWAERYQAPRVAGSDRSETKAALAVIGHFDAIRPAESFEVWLRNVIEKYFALKDDFIVEKQHPLPILPCRLNSLLGARMRPDRDRGTRAEDWADEADHDRGREEIH